MVYSNHNPGGQARESRRRWSIRSFFLSSQLPRPVKTNAGVSLLPPTAAPKTTGAADFTTNTTPLVMGGQGRVKEDVIADAERALVLPALWRAVTSNRKG